jgi:putative ABC transport system ATP-binding protein
MGVRRLNPTPEGRPKGPRRVASTSRGRARTQVTTVERGCGPRRRSRQGLTPAGCGGMDEPRAREEHGYDVLRGISITTMTTSSAILRAEALCKDFESAGRALSVLRHVSFELEGGGYLAVGGPSGSGKSTLLALLAGLDGPTAGRVVLDGQDLATLSEDDRARLRAERVGFVFQSFHLIPTLTALENVLVPLELRGQGDRARALQLLERVGLADRGHHYPAQLSGGEQQRVALARAFVHRPRVLFADEPTGNLDRANGAMVIRLMEELNREVSTTLVLVTHDPALAERARRVIQLRDGTIASDSGVSMSAEAAATA